MLTTSIIVIGAILVAVAFCSGLLIGNEWGTKETERRWSDAVGKADWYRKYNSLK